MAATTATTTTTNTNSKPVPVVVLPLEQSFGCDSSVAQLNDAERNALEATLTTNKNSVIAVFVHNTHRAGADDTFQGATYVLRRDAPVPSGLFAPNWGEHLLICKVVPASRAGLSPAATPNARIDERTLVNGVNSLGADLVATAPDEAYDPLEHMYDPNDPMLREPKPWKETLGTSSGRFVGAFRHNVEASEPEYYLAVRAGGGLASRRLHEFIEESAASPKPMTVGALLAHPLYVQCTDAAERNAKRIMAELARRCKVRVITADDDWAHTEPNAAPPELAVPDVHMVSNVLREVPAFDGNMTKFVAYYSRASPVYPDTQFVALPLDPLSGLRVYPLNYCAVPTDSDLRVQGVPFGMERVDSEASPHAVAIRHALQHDDGRRRYAAEHVTWSGRSAQQHDNARLWSYAPYTPKHDAMMAGLLGSASVERQFTLKPVRVWIARD